MNDYAGYEELCDKVRALGEHVAADYLENCAMELDGFEYKPQVSYCFLWNRAKFGRRFWNIICAKLEA